MQKYVNMYICEVCGAEYDREQAAIECEAVHVELTKKRLCQHINWKYEVLNSSCIQRTCLECGKKEEGDDL